VGVRARVDLRGRSLGPRGDQRSRGRLAIRWYPLRGVALLISYGHQMFDAAAGATPRPDEETMIVRFQLIL